ncbi:hypothetical protein C8J57DRAFT_1255288 [Mycena rebaudengoi]|nr:hypothetical protein C8J57DRAFT_1255288 [Mycena rebaudengoi]
MRTALLTGGFTTYMPLKQSTPYESTTLSAPSSQMTTNEPVLQKTLNILPVQLQQIGTTPVQILQRVEVAIINSANASGIRESTASSREILDALQASISAFKKSDIHMNTRLAVSADGTLNLTIATIGGAKIPEQPESVPDLVEELLDWAKTKSEAMLNPPSTSVRSNRKATIESLTDSELSWIVERVKNMPGFEVFNSHQNKRLSNLARLEIRSAILGKSGNTIKKSAIEVALRMGTTALAHAVNMTRIANIYYDGPHRASQVVEKIEEVGTTDSNALATFLVHQPTFFRLFGYASPTILALNSGGTAAVNLANLKGFLSTELARPFSLTQAVGRSRTSLQFSGVISANPLKDLTVVVVTATTKRNEVRIILQGKALETASIRPSPYSRASTIDFKSLRAMQESPQKSQGYPRKKTPAPVTPPQITSAGSVSTNSPIPGTVSPLLPVTALPPPVEHNESFSVRILARSSSFLTVLQLPSPLAYADSNGGNFYDAPRGFENAKIRTYLPFFFSEPSGTPPSLNDSVRTS